MVNKPLIRPAISWGGVALGGVARIPLISRFARFHTVDGSEIPFPTTWDGTFKPEIDNGR